MGRNNVALEAELLYVGDREVTLFTPRIEGLGEAIERKASIDARSAHWQEAHVFTYRIRE